MIIDPILRNAGFLGLGDASEIFKFTINDTSALVILKDGLYYYSSSYRRPTIFKKKLYKESFLAILKYKLSVVYEG